MNGADGVIQAILPVIGHIFDDKGGTEVAELFQQAGDLPLIHREGAVLIIGPAFVLVEGERVQGLIFPGEGGNLLGVNGQHHFAAGFDLLLFLLIIEHTEGEYADHCQNAQQGIEPFSTLHSEPSFF